MRIGFESSSIIREESIGPRFQVNIVKEGRNERAVSVDFSLEPGTASGKHTPTNLVSSVFCLC